MISSTTRTVALLAAALTTLVSMPAQAHGLQARLTAEDIAGERLRPIRTEFEIPWRSDQREVARQSLGVLTNGLIGIRQRNAAEKFVLLFDRPVSSSSRQRLQAMGIELLAFIGRDAYYATFTDVELDLSDLDRVDELAALSEVTPRDRVDPLLWTVLDEAPEAALRVLPPHTVIEEGGVDGVAVAIVFHADVADDRALDLLGAHALSVRSMRLPGNVYVAHMSFEQLRSFRGLHEVLWIELAPPPLQPHIADATSAAGVPTGASRPILDAVTGETLDGTGVRVMVYDVGPADDNHPTFGGRLANYDDAVGDDFSHSTFVAGIIAGTSVDAQGIPLPSIGEGVAPGATIAVFSCTDRYPEINDEIPVGLLYGNPGDMVEDYSLAINEFGAHVANNSLGSGFGGVDLSTGSPFFPGWLGSYGVTSALIDSLVTGSSGSPITSVWSVGNNSEFVPGSVYELGPPAGAKNTIVVGGLEERSTARWTPSSVGPTFDRRIKPDLMAIGEHVSSSVCDSTPSHSLGECAADNQENYAPLLAGGLYGTSDGTSFAAPVVSGVAALVIQLLAHETGEARPLPARVKALLIHFAEDLDENDDPDFHVGPDVFSGWGAVNLQNILDFFDPSLAPHGFVTDSFINQLEAPGQQPEGTIGSFSTEITPLPGETLRVTLVWDDPPALPNSTANLVNDLDLVVTRPAIGGQIATHRPWTQDPELVNEAGPYTQKDPSYVGGGLADDLNNVEQVAIAVDGQPDFVPGMPWTITVQGVRVETSVHANTLADAAPQQQFSLVVSIESSTSAGTVTVDCDGNGTDDAQELAGNDVDGDMILDTCSGDCNGNGIPDIVDLMGSPAVSQDGNGDGIPDECEPPQQYSTPGALDCTDALPICPGTYAGSLIGTTPQFYGDEFVGCVGSCGANETMALHWFSYTPVMSGDATITLSSMMDDVAANVGEADSLRVFEGGCPVSGSGAQLTCWCLSDDTDGELQFDVIAGETYYIAVGGKNPLSGPNLGSYRFTLEDSSPECLLSGPGDGSYCRPSLGFASDPVPAAGDPTVMHGPAELNICGPQAVEGTTIHLSLSNVPLPLKDPNSSTPNQTYEDHTPGFLAFGLGFSPSLAAGITSGLFVPTPGTIIITFLNDIPETGRDTGIGGLEAVVTIPDIGDVPIAVYAQLLFEGRDGRNVSNAVKLIGFPEEP